MIDQLIRPHFRAFKPYVSARSEVLNASVFLDANELPFTNPVATEAMRLNRYPDPSQIELRAKIGEKLSIDPAMIFVGVGSDEVIDLLIRLFCDPGRDVVAVLEPTYGVYKVAANINAVQTIAIDLTERFQIDVAGTMKKIGPEVKLIFLCSPNNPTGNVLNRGDILSLCKQTKGIVIVDQAYVEFADKADDLSQQVKELENLVILRTFSKAWGLAGIRLGYCIANTAIVSYLLRIKSPYNINAVTSQLALKALKDREFLADSVACIIEERTRLSKELKSLPDIVRVYPSDANFLLVEFRNAERVFDKLYTAGIIVRRRSEPGLVNCLRLTVGTKQENDLVLSEIMKVT